mgnify:CR=1 FL=1|tara:strand:- start:1757 stop:2431 length:675 start_codon:yes stop_codon:yes gene_type:complete
MNERIKFTFGGINYADADGAFSALEAQFGSLQKELGELTPVFDKLSNGLIPMLKKRFDTGELDGPPATKTVSRRSKFTRAFRKSPNGPTLKDTGRLKKSINRIGSPTKSKSGGQREVATLRIGSRGVPYAEKHLYGGEWDVPVFVDYTAKNKTGKKMYADVSEGNGKTNAQLHGRSWNRIKSLTKETVQLEVPQRNFLAFDSRMLKFVRTTTTNFFNQVMKNVG